MVPGSVIRINRIESNRIESAWSIVGGRTCFTESFAVAVASWFAVTRKNFARISATQQQLLTIEHLELCFVHVASCGLRRRVEPGPVDS